MWELVTALLPFVLLMAFWFFLMRTVRRRGANEADPVLEELKAIREELVRVRRAVETR